MEDGNLLNNSYEIIKNYKNGYNKDEFNLKCTDYFSDFDCRTGCPLFSWQTCTEKAGGKSGTD